MGWGLGDGMGWGIEGWDGMRNWGMGGWGDGEAPQGFGMANGLRLRFGAEIMAIKFGNSITGKLLFFDISVLNMEPSSLPSTSKDISIESTSWEWASTPIKHGEMPCWHGTGHRKARLVWGNWGLFQHLGSSKGGPWLLGCGHWVANRLRCPGLRSSYRPEGTSGRRLYHQDVTVPRAFISQEHHPGQTW